MELPHQRRLRLYLEEKRRKREQEKVPQVKPKPKPKVKPSKPKISAPPPKRVPPPPPPKPIGESYGDPIPGSRFYRGFCGHCGTPIRVDYPSIHFKLVCYCERCERKTPTNTKATKDDYSPWGENAVRALEDRYDITGS